MKRVEHRKPAYKHRCEHCTWLGSLEHRSQFTDVGPCDLYFCDKGELELIVARYGKGTQLTIFNMSSHSRVPEFLEGARLAELAGLVPPT